jgi:hypothetical protein
MAARVCRVWAWIQFARAADKLQSLFVRTKENCRTKFGFTPAHLFGAANFFRSDLVISD